MFLESLEQKYYVIKSVKLDVNDVIKKTEKMYSHQHVCWTIFNPHASIWDVTLSPYPHEFNRCACVCM